MKVKDMKVGERYRLTGKYGLGDEVVVLGKAQVRFATSWTKPRQITVLPLSTPEVTKIAVAKRWGARKVWVPDVVEAFQIEGPADEVERKRAERNAELKARQEAVAKAKAEREARVDAVVERAARSGVKVDKVHSQYTGNPNVSIGIDQLNTLLELAERHGVKLMDPAS